MPRKQTTKTLKTASEKLKRAYKTVATPDIDPAEMIADVELLIRAFKTTKRLLTRDLRLKAHRIARGTATTEDREVFAGYLDNVIHIAATIAGMEGGMCMWREWLGV